MWDPKASGDGFAGKDSLFSTELEKVLEERKGNVKKAFVILDQYLESPGSAPSPLLPVPGAASSDD